MPDPLSPEMRARARALREAVDDDELLEMRAAFERQQRRRDLEAMDRRNAERSARVAGIMKS